MREVILPSLPPPNGHYSHAVIFNGAAYVSGVLPMRVKPEASVKEQFDAVFDVIETFLKECESSLEKVVNCRIYIADLNDWPDINRLYSERFKSARPAQGRPTVFLQPRGGILLAERAELFGRQIAVAHRGRNPFRRQHCLRIR